MFDTFSISLQVIRETKRGSYVLGVWQGGQTSQIEILATVEPLDGNEIMLMPEGERTKEMIRIYSQQELFTADEQRSRKADIVCYEGRLFEVHKVKRWTQMIPHFASIAISKTDLKAKD